MKRKPAADPAKVRPAAGETALAAPERAELQRQGAKAAARGDHPSSNPMNEQSNGPVATGESTQVWRERQAAWQGGHAAQSKADPLPPLPPGAQGADDGPE